MRFLPLIAVLLLMSCSSNDVATDPPPATNDDAWQLVWSDEFDVDGRPDPAKWSYDVGGHGWGNNELQFYTNAVERNSRVVDGNLIIEAHKEQLGNNAYTSARMVTKGKGDWTYGRFEIRAQLPSGRGTWPAIWMLASQDEYGDGYWPDNGEIDIMEHVGYDPDVIHATVHTEAYNHMRGTQKGNGMRLATARSDFNVYALEWEENELRAYINGEEYFTFANERIANPNADYEEWPFDKPFHLLLNIAVGGSWGGVQGVDPDIWPQRMVVDYVRVYQRP